MPTSTDFFLKKIKITDYTVSISTYHVRFLGVPRLITSEMMLYQQIFSIVFKIVVCVKTLMSGTDIFEKINNNKKLTCNPLLQIGTLILLEHPQWNFLMMTLQELTSAGSFLLSANQLKLIFTLVINFRHILTTILNTKQYSSNTRIGIFK